MSSLFHFLEEKGCKATCHCHQDTECTATSTSLSCCCDRNRFRRTCPRSWLSRVAEIYGETFLFAYSSSRLARLQCCVAVAERLRSTESCKWLDYNISQCKVHTDGSTAVCYWTVYLLAVLVTVFKTYYTGTNFAAEPKCWKKVQ